MARAAETSLTAGARLGPYELVSCLGAGGMGEVYRATDTRLGRAVALKVLRAEYLEGEERRTRFEREARTLASLNHPNIATLYSFEEIEGRHVLTMELLEGESLREVLLRRSPTQRQVLGWAVQAARGLAAAHQKGIVHRDVKPENVFVTTDGLLKVLDFGIAKQAGPATSTEAATQSQATGAGAVIGTLAYLSPEQAEGLPVDARSDLFSLGVVLYELLARKHPFLKEAAGATVAAILRDSPPALSSLDPSVAPALDGIVARCLAKGRDERFQGAHDLALALEAVLAAPAGSAALTDVEERSPYPGIASFTERDSALFFGRESEVKALWDRIRAHRLLAVIGPSGAGKTSFLRAGALPARPEGWAAIVATPGVSPFRGLGQALAPELLTDADAVRQLVNVDDPGTAYHLALRWRRRHPEAVLVVDQFEELFTLNGVEVQAAFAALLARLAGDAGVRIVLSLRDDFLMRCHEHRLLAPVFDGLMPLGSLTPDALGRALVEPARRRGYRFEDEALVGEMVTAVAGERGALPLLAFAVSRLWELRDREAKVLTRNAYAEIGGVAGALARHAEATMDRIGAAREPVVRELFRNLVTAQTTRAVADRDELLSAFPDRKAAEDVLDTLVDARLLTSYELERERGDPGCCRIEIVHESLLRAWPRLVRWQAQEEEGAVLRDQLRQAARLWADKKRTGDLLWTGTAFQEFELWRGRYPGALTAVEEDFGKAMRERAQQSQRRKKAAVAAAFVALAAVAVAIGISRQQAVGAARRAEAAKLLALGQERLAADPTEALALATASLETADNREARLFAMRVLSEAPPALELVPGKPVLNPAFSPDGRQLATIGYMADTLLFEDDGRPPRATTGHGGAPMWVGDRLVLDEYWGGNLKRDPRATVWTLPDLKLERTLELGRASAPLESLGERLYVRTRSDDRSTADGPPPDFLLRRWDPSNASLVDLGRSLPPPTPQTWGPDGTTWLYAKGATLFARPLPMSSGAADVALGEHQPEIARLARFGNEVLSLNKERGMRLFTLEPGKAPRVEDFSAPAGAEFPVGLGGGWIFKKEAQGVRLWPRDSWRAARALSLRRDLSWYEAALALHPSGRWMVASTDSYTRLTFWPLVARLPRVVDGLTNEHKLLAFSPDGRWLATAWPEGTPIKLWPLDGASAPRGLQIPRLFGNAAPRTFAFDPKGRFLFVVGGSLWVAPLDGAPPIELKGFLRVPWARASAVSPSGRFVATGYGSGDGDRTVRVWDLEAGTSRAFDLQQDDDGITALAFAGESTLLSAHGGKLRRWDLATGASAALEGTAGGGTGLVINPGQSFLITSHPCSESDPNCARAVLHDLARQSRRELPAFGNGIQSVDADPSGRVVVTADRDGIVRVGRLTSGEPHVLVGHKGSVANVAISPDLKWVASAGEDATLRLWPMPDLDKPPLHALPPKELVAKLKSLTNLRAVRDAKAPTGWKIDVGPFPGWKSVPER